MASFQGGQKCSEVFKTHQLLQAVYQRFHKDCQTITWFGEERVEAEMNRDKKRWG